MNLYPSARVKLKRKLSTCNAKDDLNMNGRQKLAEYIQHICTLTENEVTDFVGAFEEANCITDPPSY